MSVSRSARMLSSSLFCERVFKRSAPPLFTLSIVEGCQGFVFFPSTMNYEPRTINQNSVGRLFFPRVSEPFRVSPYYDTISAVPPTAGDQNRYNFDGESDRVPVSGEWLQ